MLAGRHVAGPHVRNACRRHLDDLVRGPERGLRWNVANVERVVAFFRDVLRLNGGDFEGVPFALHPSQAFKVGSLFGWERWDGDRGRWVRRFRRAYIEEGKGNGKSPLAGGIGLYGLTAEGDARVEVYAAAAKKEQAGILFRDAVAMVRQSPALSRRLTFSGSPGNEYNIAWTAKGSFFRPVSRDAGKSGSGPRPKFALCDEVHEHRDRSVMEMMERGFKGQPSPLLFMITNSGHDRNSVCWEEHQHAVQVAAGTRTPDDAFTYVGEAIDDTTFAYVCALDPGDDPLEDPRCWPKANPLLGVTIKPGYLAGVVEMARKMPGQRNGILRLHFCVWTDADQAWIGRETLEAVLADFDPAVEHRGASASVGADLSGTTDLTGLAFVVQTGTVKRPREDGGEVELPTFDAWVEAWTPEEGLGLRAQRDAAPYGLWVEQGWLNTTEGPRVRYDDVAVRLARFAAESELRVLAYDRYAWDRFAEALAEVGVDVLQVAHPQAGHKRAKPAEAQLAWARARKLDPPPGLWMPGSVEALEQLIVERRIRIRRSPVLVSAAMSAALGRDALDNRWFEQRKSTQRIDVLVALAMAVGAALAPGLERPASAYERRGLLIF